MTSSRDRAHGGFTMVELVVVLAVLGIIAGAAMPLVSASIDQQRREDAANDLGSIARALEDYYTDHAAFPGTLRDTGFLGVYLQPGVQNGTVVDAWGSGGDYVYSVSKSPDVATVHSVDSNRKDDGAANEELKVEVFGAAPGHAKTRLRMLVIVEALANHIEAGGALTGNWAKDRAALGLGSAYQNDGFGSSFRLEAGTLTLSSDGPDRKKSTADDITF
ncbi:MAG: prepilin-type N-terminal cleavage/methylation domain-containing protein [Planctomycetes bacterium]|nr:prepilin-type N-terminal cleavage/methylation domain-containing protein [Planctomycetota bacterium]